MRTLVALTCVVLLTQGFSINVEARSVVHLGTPKATIDRLLRHDTSSGPYCQSAAQFTQCDYISGRTHITASYNSHTRNVANDFITWNVANPASRSAWRFLTTLLPPGARRLSCRHIKRTGGANGPANACLYKSGKHHDIVAQYLAPTDPQTQGEVAQDEGYDHIAAAR